MSEMAIDYQRRPITVEEYDKMAEVGIIGCDERVELIDGEIILMPPVGPPIYRVWRVSTSFLCCG
ncbi:MAG: hypothetical protein GIX03_03650 [Candidatus Eremiobacteraeota bacterium]|nr:hypothetical protein [Candidatus Eremiobacteraeota bacterium]MBC5802108.1 hypothetical protein [Candidatus Eremiobacteraeota bacterium]MBC5824314.1 hypothetical protein [Candidatus Eremiobacteraeota bacterium]